MSLVPLLVFVERERASKENYALPASFSSPSWNNYYILKMELDLLWEKGCIIKEK